MVRDEARIGSGDSEGVTVFGHFANCDRYDEGSGTRREVQLVRYRVLWVVPAQQEVELGIPMDIRSPPDARCPVR